MSNWSPYPFVRLFASLALGIITSHYLTFSLAPLLYFLICSFTITALVSSFLLKSKASGIISLCLIFVIGFVRWQSYDQSEFLQKFEATLQKSKAYTARVTSPPAEKEKYLIYDVQTEQFALDSSEIEFEARIKLYIRKDSIKKTTPEYGDVLMIKGQPFRIPGPKNPHEFDYADYMKGQNIFFQQFVKSTDYHVIHKNTGSLVMNGIFDIRQRFESIIKSHVIEPDNQAIALALLIGQKDELSREIKQSYAAAGAMHVLAVSGLHVGIIYMLVMGVFKVFRSNPNVKIASSFLCIICLWLYALITGFSPSILRAVTMFSVIIFGQCLGRKSNIYNSMALSAFLLLFYNPNFLFSVGFQLSYLAVLGIVTFYNPLYNKFYFKYKVLDWVWSVTCLSISAQIATFPISVYYFHQFPTYFLISNLIVIPAAFCIMILGIATIIFGTTPIADFFGIGLEYFIAGLNQFVNWIYQLPISIIDWLYLTPTQTWLVYLSIILTFLFFTLKQFKYFLRASFFLSIAILLGFWNLFESQNQNRTVIYNVRGIHASDDIIGNRARLSTLQQVNNMQLVKYQIEPNRINSYLPRIKEYQLRDTTQFAIGDFGILRVRDEKQLFYLHKAINPEAIRLKIKTDYLIISNNSSQSLSELVDFFDFQQLIVDSSNDYYTSSRLKKQAEKLGIEIALVSEGAVEI